MVDVRPVEEETVDRLFYHLARLEEIPRGRDCHPCQQSTLLAMLGEVVSQDQAATIIILYLAAKYAFF